MLAILLSDPYADRGWKALLLILAPVSSVVLMAVSVWSAARFLRRRRPALAGWCLALGAVAMLSWWAVAPIARNWAHWTDPDGDGILSDMGQGAYDRVDVYGPHWAILVLAVTTASAILLSGTRAWAHRRAAARATGLSKSPSAREAAET